MNTNRSPQVFLILAALMLAGGTGAALFQYGEVSEKWDTLAGLKKDARDPKEIESELEDVTRKVAESKTQIEHLEKGVPAFAYVPTMLRELENFGVQNGIEVLGVRPIPKAESKDKKVKAKKNPYEELAIEVKGRGVFTAVQAFVSALEKFPKIVGVRAVSLQPKNDPANSASRNLDVTIELRAYLFPPAEDERLEPSEAAGPGDGAGRGTAHSVSIPWFGPARTGSATGGASRPARTPSNGEGVK